MSLGNVVYVQVNSGDFSAGTNAPANKFTNILSAPLNFDPDRQYEICVMDTEFPLRQNTSSVYIGCNLVDNQIINGSQVTNGICWIPRAILQTGTTGQPFYHTTIDARKWYPLTTRKVQKIDITFTLSTGDAMPVNAGDFSTVCFGIREIIF